MPIREIATSRRFSASAGLHTVAIHATVSTASLIACATISDDGVAVVNVVAAAAADANFVACTAAATRGTSVALVTAGTDADTTAASAAGKV